MDKKEILSKSSECVIKITGTQIVDGEEDVIELTTAANYFKEEDNYYIVYDETEATGFPDAQTVLEYEPCDKRITMSRSGPTPSQLIIEQSRRHQCSYDTGHGTLMIGISGKNIKSTLDGKTGSISFSYDLDVDTNLTSENSVSIEIL